MAKRENLLVVQPKPNYFGIKYFWPRLRTFKRVAKKISKPAYPPTLKIDRYLTLNYGAVILRGYRGVLVFDPVSFLKMSIFKKAKNDRAVLFILQELVTTFSVKSMVVFSPFADLRPLWRKGPFWGRPPFTGVILKNDRRTVVLKFDHFLIIFSIKIRLLCYRFFRPKKSGQTRHRS